MYWLRVAQNHCVFDNDFAELCWFNLSQQALSALNIGTDSSRKYRSIFTDRSTLALYYVSLLNAQLFSGYPVDQIIQLLTKLWKDNILFMVIHYNFTLQISGCIQVALNTDTVNLKCLCKPTHLALSRSCPENWPSCFADCCFSFLCLLITPWQFVDTRCFVINCFFQALE